MFARLSQFFSQSAGVLGTLFFRPGWRAVFDIIVISFIMYQVIKLIRHTRANSLLKGLGIILVFTWLSEMLELSALNWFLRQIINTGMIMVVVLFQPEIRRALEQIGRSSWWRGMVPIVNEEAPYEGVIDELVSALTTLSRRRVGALIVIERSTGLNDVIATGTELDALVSASLIENVFEPNTPLHDGAMILRGDRIVAAACILQLSEDQGISRELGTRHRAALGISETTDAVTLIVSEETGIISMAREGRLTRYLDGKTLPAMLMDLLGKPQPKRLALLVKRRPKQDEG